MRRRDDLALELTGLVYVRALLESRGASIDEIAAHTNAIARLQAELATLEPVAV